MKNDSIPLAPKSGGTISSTEGGGQQQQQRRRRIIETSNHSTISDSNHNDSVDHNPDTPDEKHSKKNKNTKGGRQRTRRNGTKVPLSGDAASIGAGGGGGSVLFTVLVIGIVFSLIDVIYIIGFVDQQDLMMGQQDQQQGGDMRMGHQQQQQDSSGSAAAAAKNYAPNSIPGQGLPANLKQKQSIISNSQPHGVVLKGNDGDKVPLFNLLTKAGFKIDPIEDQDLIDDLPPWSEVTGMYGSEPVIFGLDQCEAFQQQSDPSLHFLGVAGTFNSGTNLLAEMLIANCRNQARMDKFGMQQRGIRWQVPWGKHHPPGDEEFRQGHKTQKDHNVDTNNVLAAVTIRDPLTWLGSMCRHHYTAHFPWTTSRCPHFSLPDLGTRVVYNGFEREHESILHLWNSYYTEYKEAQFPRLIVRYEDLIFHPEEVTEKVCKCAGGSMRRDGRFKYIVDSAKKGVGAHGKVRTGYADALVKYGSEQNRYKIYKHASDLEYIRDHVDPHMMELMQYPYPDPAKVNTESR